MKYPFECNTHGEFIVTAPMSEGPQDRRCPDCGEEGVRIYTTQQEIWYCQGAHKTDYDNVGDKQEQLRKRYERDTGEKAPPPDPSVPRNYKRE